MFPAASALAGDVWGTGDLAELQGGEQREGPAPLDALGEAMGGGSRSRGWDPSQQLDEHPNPQLDRDTTSDLGDPTCALRGPQPVFR